MRGYWHDVINLKRVDGDKISPYGTGRESNLKVISYLHLEFFCLIEHGRHEQTTMKIVTKCSNLSTFLNLVTIFRPAMRNALK